MENTKSKPRLKLVLYNDRIKTVFKEELILKEILDNLILTLEMSMDAVDEVDNSAIFGDEEKRHLYYEILEALEYSIDISMGGQAAFIEGMDLKPDEYFFMKKGEE